MRILHVGKFFPPHPGGMEVFLADLIDAQQRQGLDAQPWYTAPPCQATHPGYSVCRCKRT